MDCIAWLKDVHYAFKLSNSCYQMGTGHSQWKCVACFLSPGLQKESFECATAGLKGHSEVSVALTSPTWALPRPRVQLGTARALLQECWAPARPCPRLAVDCWSRTEPLSWFPGLTLAALVPSARGVSPALPALWSQPSGSRRPAASPRGTWVGPFFWPERQAASSHEDALGEGASSPRWSVSSLGRRSSRFLHVRLCWFGLGHRGWPVALRSVVVNPATCLHPDVCF